MKNENTLLTYFVICSISLIVCIVAMLYIVSMIDTVQQLEQDNAYLTKHIIEKNKLLDTRTSQVEQLKKEVVELSEKLEKNAE